MSHHAQDNVLSWWGWAPPIEICFVRLSEGSETYIYIHTPLHKVYVHYATREVDDFSCLLSSNLYIFG